MILNSEKTFYNYQPPDPHDDGDGDEVLLYVSGVGKSLTREQFQMQLINYVESILDLAEEHDNLIVRVEIRGAR